MTEAQISQLTEELNLWLEEAESPLRITYPDAEKIAQRVEPAFPAFDP